ncbi:MAG: DUF7594 domain-containing protein [Bacteroidales bacterium]
MNLHYIHYLRTKLHRISKIAIFLCSIFTPSISVGAATFTATTIADLQSKINSAASGDVINLTNGHYTNNNITISKTNITVQAATSGGVYLDGTNAITISGNNNTFSGFQFTNGTITSNVVTVTGNNNTVTQLNFNGYSASKMVQLEGQYNVVSFCNFQNKPAPNLVNHGGDGDMVQIIPNATNPGYNTIRYCSFQHMPGFGGDFGNECIRIGDGAYSTYISRTVVEYCYFEDTGLGDSEAISVKSMENTLRYNTMNNNPNAMFCFRNGDDNVAYGNFFIKSGGIRCKQSNNAWIYNNYFEMAGIGWDNTLPGSGSRAIYFLTYPGYNNNYNVIHNTFYKCGEIEIQSGMTNCTWANNAIYSNSGNIFSNSGTTDGQTFVGNLYTGTLGLTIPSGMVKNDPKLTLNSDGYYGLSATSPAIDAANASYTAIPDISNITDDPNLMLDISGQLRPTSVTLKDVGSDEYGTTGAVLNKPLTVSNVGPSYLGGPSTPTLTNQTIVFNSLPTKSVGDANFSAGAYSTSGLTVAYSSSNTAVATIVNGQIHIVGAGTTNITASQAGNSTYYAATNVIQSLTVTPPVLLNQTITFNALTTKSTLDSDFDPGAIASSGLAVSYASSNTSVATIVNGLVHLIGGGMTTITASQSGNGSYNAAPDVTQSLSVEAVSNVSNTLNPVADTYVYGSATTTNNGTLTDLVSKKGSNSTGDRIIYMQFDISGQNIFSISSAKVRLYANSVPSASTITASRTTDIWTETGITYANCPVKGTDINSVLVSAASAYYEWDVTSYVQSQFSTNDNLISFVFNNSTADGIIVKFNSKEATSNTPQLYLTLNQIVTSISEERTDNFKVYLNLTSSSATCHYFLQNEGKVSVRVYSIDGQLLKNILQNQNQGSGFHQFSFDTFDLNTGIYLIRFDSNKGSKTVKFQVRI